jgi:hypothetical protein
MAEKNYIRMQKLGHAGYLRRDFLLGALVLPIMGCGRRGTVDESAGNVSAKSPEPKMMGLEELRSAFKEGFGNEERLVSSDIRNVPIRMDFLGRSRNMLWVEHIEGEYRSFVRTDGIEVKRESWPDDVSALSCSVVLVMPREAYSDAEGFLEMLREAPRWYREGDLKAYAGTRLMFDGFYLTYKGRQSGPNVLSHVSVRSYDSSLPEGRLTGLDIIIDRRSANINSDAIATDKVRALLAEVRAEYPFGQLEKYYEQGLAAFAKRGDNDIKGTDTLL